MCAYRRVYRRMCGRVGVCVRNSERTTHLKLICMVMEHVQELPLEGNRFELAVVKMVVLIKRLLITKRSMSGGSLDGLFAIVVVGSSYWLISWFDWLKGSIPPLEGSSYTHPNRKRRRALSDS